MSEKSYDEELEYEEDDSQAIARCEECGELIYEDNDDVYIDDDGNYFCNLQCVLDHYSIRKIEVNL
jgi:formylmethanofuran dehydrogenase subunit E